MSCCVQNNPRSFGNRLLICYNCRQLQYRQVTICLNTVAPAIARVITRRKVFQICHCHLWCMFGDGTHNIVTLDVSIFVNFMSNLQGEQ